MKAKIIVFLFLSFLLNSCAQETKTNSIESNVKTKNQNNLTVEELKNKEYYLAFKYPVPFEILVNDVVVEKEMENGMNGANNINQFILKNGAQKVKIKIFHPYASKGGKLKPNDFKLLQAGIYISKNNSEEEMTIVKSLEFPDIDTPVPYFEYEWQFEAELPFILEGWKNSQNLKDMDESILEKEVLKKFTELRNSLDSGNSSKFLEEIKKCNQDFYKSNYFSKKEISDYESNLSDFYSSQSGNMLPIEGYKLRILGDGKAVTLERIDNKYMGECVLIAEDPKEKLLYQNYVILHKPQNSDNFEIIRINSKYTSLDD